MGFQFYYFIFSPFGPTVWPAFYIYIFIYELYCVDYELNWIKKSTLDAHARCRGDNQRLS